MPHPVFTRFPANTLIKGGNVAFRASDNASPYTFFGGMWGGGSQTYDESWITNQIDVAHAMGCNTVRIFGDLELQIATTLNSATYLSRWDSVISYAAGLGMYVVVTGASVYELNGVASAGVITSTARNLLKDLYNTVRVHANVIAFDPIQESYAWVVNGQGNENGLLHQANITAGQLLTVQATVYGDLKGESADLPITWSGLQQDYNIAAAFAPFTPRANAAAYTDYLSFHCYYPVSVGDVFQAKQEARGRPIVIDEFGSPTLTHPQIGDGCPYINMLRVAQQANIDGVICWALADQNSDTHDCWGCADSDGTLRSGRGVVMATFPTVPVGAAGNFTFSGTRMRRAI